MNVNLKNEDFIIGALSVEWGQTQYNKGLRKTYLAKK